MSTNRYTRGWIRMQVLSGLVEVGRFVPGIANSDTEIDRQTLLLLMEFMSARVGKPIQWNRPAPRHGIKVSTVVGYLEAVLSNNGTLPENTNGEPPSDSPS